MDIRPKDAARMLGVSQVWLFQLRKKGTGPTFERRGGMYYYDLGGLINWLVERQTRVLTERIEVLEKANG